MEEPEIFWYRYEGYSTSSDDGYYIRSHLHCRQLRVIKTTPCGVWLSDYVTKRFVLKDARKRFACPTEQEALESFLARKQRQRVILNAQARRVTEQINLAELKLGEINKDRSNAPTVEHRQEGHQPAPFPG